MAEISGIAAGGTKKGARSIPSAPLSMQYGTLLLRTFDRDLRRRNQIDTKAAHHRTHFGFYGYQHGEKALVGLYRQHPQRQLERALMHPCQIELVACIAKQADAFVSGDIQSQQPVIETRIDSHRYRGRLVCRQRRHAVGELYRRGRCGAAAPAWLQMYVRRRNLRRRLIRTAASQYRSGYQ